MCSSALPSALTVPNHVRAAHSAEYESTQGEPGSQRLEPRRPWKMTGRTEGGSEVLLRDMARTGLRGALLGGRRGASGRRAARDAPLPPCATSLAALRGPAPCTRRARLRGLNRPSPGCPAGRRPWMPLKKSGGRAAAGKTSTPRGARIAEPRRAAWGPRIDARAHQRHIAPRTRQRHRAPGLGAGPHDRNAWSAAPRKRLARAELRRVGR